MKKSLFLFAAGLIAANISFAQGFYLRGALGYAFPQAAQTVDGNSIPYNGTVSTLDTLGTTSYNIKKASFGSGLHLSLAAGYMISEHVGIDAAFNFGLSPTSYTSNLNNVVLNGVPSNLSYVQKAAGPVFFTPSLVLQTNGDNLNLYTRVGVVIPINTKITQDQVSTNLPNTGAITTEDDTWEIKSKLSLGFAMAVGVQYPISEKVKITGELSVLSLSVLTKESTVTKVTVNGQEYNLSAIPDSLKHVVFSTNFTGAANDYYHQAAYTMPFSNIGLHVGFIYSLSSPHSSGGSKGNRTKRKSKETDGYYHH